MNYKIFIIVFFIVLLIIFNLYKLMVYYLKKNSLIYKEILKLNNYYFFFDDVSKKIIIEDFVNSKKSVLKYDFTSKVSYLITINHDNLLLTIQDIYHNRKYLKSYNLEFFNLINQIKGNRIRKYFERRLCLKIKLKPTVNFNLKISVSYKKYTIYNNYDYDELLLLVKKLKNVKKRKEIKRKFIKNERLKLNDGLRYDVFKRDSFKCKICGSNSSDGIKLHVDHIIPVSRGGKTEFNNLQTLCERCNLGKGNKI